MSRRENAGYPPGLEPPTPELSNGVPRICYHACEELYHQLGGKGAGLKLMRIFHEGVQHYYLSWQTPWYVLYIDPTAGQFNTLPPYAKGKGCGFMTKERSKSTERLFGQM